MCVCEILWYMVCTRVVVCLCVCMYAYMCIGVCVFMCVRASVCVCGYVCVRACVANTCVCVFVNVPLQGKTRRRGQSE